MKDDFERSVESSDYTCKIFEDMRMGCYNITPVDLALSSIQLKLEDMVYINISMYDIRDSYDEETKLTMFYLKFEKDSKKFQVGEALIKGYYISIDM